VSGGPKESAVGSTGRAEPGAAPLSIRVTDLHLDFEVFGDRRAGVRDRLMNRNATGRSVVQALRGVSLDVREGETVGIVGFNGSGKSTLLSTIAGVLPATSGSILVSDEPKLMGVGAALLGQVSGYRNIRLGCLALGMSLDDVDEVIDDLVAFTELDDAIHRPLNTYSSGMKARVHFVVATAIMPKILLIDEALGVGDRKFRARSRQRIEEIIESAGTLLMVNHSLGELANFCRRGIWLDEGLVRLDGPIDDVIEAYSTEP
jgi:teichoic acid transport system ATP-binding protein